MKNENAKNTEKEIVIEKEQQSLIKQTIVKEIINILADNNLTISEACDVLHATRNQLYKQNIRVSS